MLLGGSSMSAESLLRLAQSAVHEMCRDLCRSPITDTLSDLNERQFEFYLASTLKAKDRFPFLDYPYPRGRRRSDLTLWQNHDDYSGGEYLWLETKFNVDSRSQVLANKKWIYQRDYEKLKSLWSVKRAPWDAFHSGYWVWLCVTQAEYYLDHGAMQSWCSRNIKPLCRGSMGPIAKPEWKRAYPKGLQSYSLRFGPDRVRDIPWGDIHGRASEFACAHSCFALRPKEDPLLVHLVVAKPK